jgi:hypothetical protein
MVRRGLLLSLASAALVTPAIHSSASPPATSPRPGYVGDAACLPCHQQQSTSFLHTAHHLTSQLPTIQSVHGSFQNGTNTLTIVDPATSADEPGLFFKMESRDNAFFETAFTGWPPQLQHRTEHVDLVTGSGKRGQTYLYWQDDRLFELPISFWTDGHQWINSPGYTNGSADFSRPINPGCLECHATYIKPLSADPTTNRFDRDTLVTGISCETCHGPGAAHVALQTARLATAPQLSDQAILNPAKFSRDRQVDLCALCHNGIQREPLAPAFSYLPGKPLQDFFKPLPAATLEHPDVHGNQVGLLERSRCFASSPSMTCSTCHNVHTAERTAAAYSDRCLTCHQWQSCGVAKTLGHRITQNCIDCHMPIEPTNVIVSETADKQVHATMRNHWIKIYPKAHLP